MVQRGVRGGVHLRRPSFQPRRPSFPVKMVVKMAENGGEEAENGVESLPRNLLTQKENPQ